VGLVNCMGYSTLFLLLYVLFCIVLPDVEFDLLLAVLGFILFGLLGSSGDE